MTGHEFTVRVKNSLDFANMTIKENQHHTIVDNGGGPHGR
jgi:hypothetical protein